MTSPPKAPEILVDRRTHHSLEVSWKPFLEKLEARLGGEGGRLRVEVEIARLGNSWEVSYKGYDSRCVIASLQPSEDYGVRFRFGNGHGWGEFSDSLTVRTADKPFSGEDVHKQIRRRNAEQLRIVLTAQPAAANAPDDKGFSPLAAAAMEGLIEFCEILKEFRADIDWAGDNGKTCLMLVAYKGRQDSCDWLISNGASLNCRDRKGLTPLHFAVDGEKLEIVRLLLEQGADLHAKDNKGCTPLIRCASHKNNGSAAIAVELIKRGAKVNETDSVGQTALFYCVINKHEKMAAILLQHGADARATNSQGVSPMKIVDRVADQRTMRELLHSHVDAKP